VDSAPAGFDEGDRFRDLNVVATTLMRRFPFSKPRIAALLLFVFSSLLLLALGLPFPELVCASDDPLNEWHLRAPLSNGRPGNEYRGVAYGNNHWVAVGTRGAIEAYTGGALLSQNSGTSAALNGATFANGLFVAVGEGGAILISGDTYSWTNQGQASLGNLCGVTSGGGMYAVVGERGMILVSSDLQEWKVALSGTTNTLHSVAFGDGSFVAVGGSGLILSSTNGMEWTSRNSSSTLDLRSVCFGNGRFAVVGALGTILTSSDGTNWTPQNSATTNWLNGVAWRDGLFVAVGQGGIARSSPDGVRWSSQDVGWSSADLLAIVPSDHGEFMAVGPSGTIRGVAVWNSQLIWVNHDLVNPDSFASVAYGSGAFLVAARDATTLTSRDGATWVWRQRLFGFYINNVCYGQGMFVGAGLSGQFQGIGAASTYNSFNSGVWDGVTQLAWAGMAEFRQVQYGNRQFVVVGDRGLIGTSEDGLAWELRNPGTNSDLRGVAYGNGRFVAVGPKVVMTSPDGISWSTNDAGVPLAGIAFGDGLFVAVGTSGAIVTSDDGELWTRRDLGTIGPLFGVGYGAGIYVAVGSGIVSSRDGTNWVMRPISTTSVLRSVAYGDWSFVAVGDGATVLQSGSLVPRLTGKHAPEQGSFQVLAEGWVEAGSRLQATTAFGGWGDLLVSTNSQWGASFLDTVTTNHLQRFYRLALP